VNLIYFNKHIMATVFRFVESVEYCDCHFFAAIVTAGTAVKHVAFRKFCHGVTNIFKLLFCWRFDKCFVTVMVIDIRALVQPWFPVFVYCFVKFSLCKFWCNASLLPIVAALFLSFFYIAFNFIKRQLFVVCSGTAVATFLAVKTIDKRKCRILL